MNEDKVPIDFQVGGIREVQQAFQGIEQALLRLERNAAMLAQRETKTRTDEARKGATARKLIEESTLKDLTRLYDQKLSQTNRFAAARIEIERRAADRQKQINVELFNDLGKIAEKHHQLEVDLIKKTEAAAKAAADRRRQFGQAISGAAMRGTTGALGSIANYGGMAMSLGGGLALGTAIQRGLSAEVASVALANSMFNPNDPEQQAWLRANGVGGRFDNKAILAFAGKAQASSGLDKDELARGWQDYIAKSSDWKSLTTKEGQDRLIDMAQLAKATGSDFGQVMSAAGSLKVQNPNLTDSQMMEMMYSIIGQGKMGAVEMKDLAAHASVITSGSGSYAMDQRKAQQALLGLSQIAIRTSGSPAEAATAVARFSSDVQHHAKDMNASFGIDAIKDKKTGALASPSEILAQIFEKTGGNTAKFGEGKGNVGLGRESVRIAQALAPTYRGAVETARARGETDEKKLAHIGAEAVRAEVLKFENAGYRKEDVSEDLKRVQSTTQERFNKVTRDLTERLEARFLPLVEKLAASFEKGAPQLDRFIDALSRVAGFLIENPYKGVAAIIAANVAKEFAAEGLRKAAEKALSTSLGQAGVIAGTAYITAQMGMIAINEMAKEQAGQSKKDFESSSTAFAEAKALERDALEGKMTPEKRKRLQELRQQMSEQVAYDTEHVNDKSMLEKVGWFMGGDSGLGKMLGGDGEEAKRYQAEREERLKQSTEALKELDKAVGMATRAMRDFSNEGNPSSPFHPTRKGSLTSPERK